MNAETGAVDLDIGRRETDHLNFNISWQRLSALTTIPSRHRSAWTVILRSQVFIDPHILTGISGVSRMHHWFGHCRELCKNQHGENESQ